MRLYPPSAFNAAQGASVPCPPHVDEAVKQIHAACKGLGTDEQALIAVLGSKSPETRNLIGRRYQELYGKPLRSLLRSETSGDFGRLLAMVATPLPETEAQILRDATKGIGTNESLIVQVCHFFVRAATAMRLQSNRAIPDTLGTHERGDDPAQTHVLRSGGPRPGCDAQLGTQR